MAEVKKKPGSMVISLILPPARKYQIVSLNQR